MNKLTVLSSLFVFLIVGILLQIVYFQNSILSNDNAKKSFVNIVGLPDLAVVTENYFTRHRSLQDSYSVFNDGPEHIDYFPTMYTYKENIGKR
jgi:ABC-type arginine transport system permease subunit